MNDLDDCTHVALPGEFKAEDKLTLQEKYKIALQLKQYDRAKKYFKQIQEEEK